MTRRQQQAPEYEREAWRLRIEGYSQQEIADRLSIAQSTVCEALKRIEQKLAEEFRAEAEEIKARQTEQHERIYREAMEQWRRSCGDAELERVTTKEVSLVNEDDEGAVPVPGVEVRTTNERKAQSGNPALLEKAMAALSAVRGIWGLDAPVKSDSTVTQTVKAWVDWPDGSSSSDSTNP